MAHDWPKELSISQAAALCSIKGVGLVAISSEQVLSEDGQRVEAKVQTVDVQNKSDVTQEMMVGEWKVRGDVVGAVLCDGKTAYFEAKSGKAIGREFRLRPAEKPQGRTNTGVKAARTSQDVARQYMR
jgi:hypothetical protein